MKSSDLYNDQASVQFLLDCLTASRADEKAVALTAPSLDFAAIARAANRHGVEPLVARCLDLTPEGSRAASAAHRILTHARAHELQNLYLTDQLTIILREFGRAGVEALVIKGPVLAKLAYGDVALRPFSDLDIVVRANDVPLAASLLMQAGFDPGPYDDEAFRSNFFQAVEANFQRRDERLNVDLHWELSPPHFAFGPAGDGIWRRSITIELGAAKVRTLSHEDHLLYLAVHHARHGWDSLKQLCDIAYLVNRVPIAWDLLMARAAATNSTRILAVALLMARDRLGVSIPMETLAILRRDARAVGLAAALGDEMAGDRAPRGGPLRRLSRILDLIERPADRVRYMMLGGFAPTLIDRRYLRMRRELYPAYFLLRPVRIGTAALRALGRSLGAHKIADDQVGEV